MAEDARGGLLDPPAARALSRPRPRPPLEPRDGERALRAVPAAAAGRRGAAALRPTTVLPEPRLNTLLPLFDPAGLRPRIGNWEVVARTVLRRVRREAALEGDRRTEEILERLAGFPGREGALCASPMRSGPQALVIPVELDLRGRCGLPFLQHHHDPGRAPGHNARGAADRGDARGGRGDGKALEARPPRVISQALMLAGRSKEEVTVGTESPGRKSTKGNTRRLELPLHERGLVGQPGGELPRRLDRPREPDARATVRGSRAGRSSRGRSWSGGRGRGA